MMKFLILALILCLSMGTFTLADEPKPVILTASAVQVSTPVYKPSRDDISFQYGTYEYDVSWQGIPAASATLSLVPRGDNFQLVATAKTASAIDIFYKLRYRAEGLLDKEFAPLQTRIVQTENSKERATSIDFFSNGSIKATRVRKGKETEVEEFDSKNFTLDPFSSAILARSLDWKVGESRTFDTFNGKTRYLITLTCESETTMEVNGEMKQVWVVVPTVVNLNDNSKSKKLRRAEIFVTADQNRELLQIKSEVFIGSVSIRLKSFTPQRDPGLQFAAGERREWVF